LTNLQPQNSGSLPLKRIVAAWWPLAIAWLLMSAEGPLIAAVVARLADPTINLAAYGSVANPLINMILAPITTLLSLSTAMSKDWDSFQKGRKIMFFLGGGLTLLYMAIAFTPLYYIIVEKIIGAPAQIVEPARMAMFFGVPWTFAVAYRRFHQGLMIRFEHSRMVTIGTLLRFCADILVLTFALTTRSLPGAVAATLMMVFGVVTEAIYVGLRVRPVVNGELRRAPALPVSLRLSEMIAFFIPLALTPFLNMLVRPIGSAALSRLPDPLQALAIWPVITSFSWLIITPGSAFNEVVIAQLDRPGSVPGLKRFMIILMAAQFSLMLLLALTPLAYQWFKIVSALPEQEARLAANAFLLLIPSSLISPLNSWFAGNILHKRKSRVITEGMIIFLCAFSGALFAGGFFPNLGGIYITLSASVLAGIAQTTWLGLRSRALPQPA
jgi:hypothetical protein